MGNRLLKLIALFGLINFAAFVAIYLALGGDALTGKVTDGRYYLNNHGAFTEVSHAVFLYSAIHACSAILGLALAFLAGRILRHRKII